MHWLSCFCNKSPIACGENFLSELFREVQKKIDKEQHPDLPSLSFVQKFLSKSFYRMSHFAIMTRWLQISLVNCINRTFQRFTRRLPPVHLQHLSTFISFSIYFSIASLRTHTHKDKARFSRDSVEKGKQQLIYYFSEIGE